MVGDSIRLGRRQGWNGSHIRKMGATIHERGPERSIFNNSAKESGGD